MLRRGMEELRNRIEKIEAERFDSRMEIEGGIQINSKVDEALSSFDKRLEEVKCEVEVEVRKLESLVVEKLVAQYKGQETNPHKEPTIQIRKVSQSVRDKSLNNNEWDDLHIRQKHTQHAK